MGNDISQACETYMVKVPIRLVSCANMSEHWAVKRNRQVSQQRDTYLSLRNVKCMPKTAPNAVKMVRFGKRLLDTDNLVIAFKHIRDEIAYFFGVKDSPSDPISWEYDQFKDKEYSIVLEIRYALTVSLVDIFTTES